MKNNITLRAILSELKKQNISPEHIEVSVNADPVWDYKDINGTLSLIHDNNLVTKNYEKVMLDELVQEEFLDLPIVSEMHGDVISEAELLKLKVGKRRINFKINV